MKIYDFEVIDRCLFWKEKKILVVGDLHLGYEEALFGRNSGVPRNQLKDTNEILRKIFKKTGKVEKIILLGDVKHVFGGILRQEFEDFEVLIEFFKKNMMKDGEIIIIRGNHDAILKPMVKNYENVLLVESYFEKKYLFMHGDPRSIKKNYEIMQKKEVECLILGHFHPAYVLKDKKSVKKEKYKCFLYGFSKEYSQNVIFVPSFFPLITGSDIITDLELYTKGMKLVLIDESGKAYDFGNVKSL